MARIAAREYADARINRMNVQENLSYVRVHLEIEQAYDAGFESQAAALAMAQESAARWQRDALKAQDEVERLQTSFREEHALVGVLQEREIAAAQKDWERVKQDQAEARLIKEPWKHEGHNPVQHRDAKPPWCHECGWTSPTAAAPARLASQINPFSERKDWGDNGPY